MWQDFIFSIGNVVFIVALIPALRAKDKPPVLTSAMNSGMLSVYSFTFFTLGLYYSSVASFATALMWVALMVQGMKNAR